MHNILITNNGVHSPEKWAEATASHIVEIADHVTGEKRGAAIKLQAAIIDILEGHHSTVQNGERGKLKEEGHSRLSADHDPAHHATVDSIVEEINGATKGTQWEGVFGTAEARAHLQVLLRSHFATSMNIERLHHCDRHAGHEAVEAFRKQHNAGSI